MSRITLILMTLSALCLAGCGARNTSETTVNETTDRNNPLLSPSDLPYGLPPFDQIENKHYVPAFEQGIAEEISEIEAIANNPEPPTFDNTIVALELSGQSLTRSRRVFNAMTGAHTNDELKSIQTQMAPRFAMHNDNIVLNQALFERISELHAARDKIDLDAESLRLLDDYHKDFKRAGAELGEEGKQQLRDINTELAELSTQFSQNVLNEANDSAVVVEQEAELGGLSDSAIRTAAQEAESRGLDGKFALTLRNTTQQPILTALKNRSLRQRIQEASMARGSRANEYDNRALVIRILELRAGRANLLGYENHAAYVLEDRTAGTIAAVNDMLGQLGPRAVANARLEAQVLQAVIDEVEPESFTLASWDWLYYTDMLKRKLFNFDENELRPYFEIDRVLKDGVFFFAQRLYGMTFVERAELPVYQEDVRIFEAFLDDEPVGLFLFDPYARESKRGGAWMNSYMTQSDLLGTRPVVANHLNVVKPASGEPTLLTLDEATTMFHEFGHALHGLFSNVTYPRFSGTSVPRDFVEYPSQVHEMWVTWPEVLANYAVHHVTGEPIPQDLLDRVIASQKFNQGFDKTEYLAAAIVDQAWHQLPRRDIPPAEAVLQFESKALEDAGMNFDLVPPRYQTPYFSHIMGGYSAGYYSYIWSEVLDADTVQWFVENGGLKRENGDHFRNTLLSQGGSRDAMLLFESFRGAEPSIEPLLERLGLE